MDYYDVMSMMSDWSEDSSGNTPGLSFEFSPGDWIRLTSCFWNPDEGGYYDYEMQDEYRPMPSGEWVMVTMTTDASEVKLYVNGGLLSTMTKYETTVHDTTNPESFFWNGRDHYGNYGNSCKMVFLGVWDRVLETEKITELFNGGAGLAYADL